MMIPRVYQPDTPAAERAGESFVPPADAVAKMMKYNEELAKAGALVSLDGLHPLAKGARVSFKGGKNTVTDGPFIESKEVIGGYWFIIANDLDEAVEIAKENPCLTAGLFFEIRPIDPQPATPHNTRQSS